MTIRNFIKKASPLLDVRSPSEFLQGHIPGALSFPLFSDEERAQVGTLYKKKGKDSAVLLGLQFVGPKLAFFVEEATKLSSESKTLRLYCARGGMRSGSLSWLLQTAGFHCITLKGGYKSFRHWTLQQFLKVYHLKVLGGLTGSGKTDLLQQLALKGEQVLFLEELANHKGSSFGHLGLPPQPSTEHFENILAISLDCYDSTRTLWVEDESRMIGTCRIPQELWVQMDVAPLFWLNSSREERIRRLCTEYGHHPLEALILATQRLTKRIGLQKVEEIALKLKENKIEIATAKILDYYDKAYLYSLEKRKRSYKLIENINPIAELQHLSY